MVNFFDGGAKYHLAWAEPQLNVSHGSGMCQNYLQPLKKKILHFVFENT